MEDAYEKCKKCKKFKTPECPNSHKCFATIDKPYFEKEEDFSKKKRFIGWMKEMLKYLFS
nr:MAG TPA: ubiquitin protein ligase [Caudoviricetes sp.]